MGRLNSEIYSFSHSEMSVYKDCRRKWMLQYYMKLRRRRTPRAKARDTGTLVHAALEQFYVAGSLDNDMSEEMMMNFLVAARDDDMLKVDETERALVKDVHNTARILCTGYVEWLRETGADVGLKFNPNPSEVELRVPGPVEGTEIMGIVDLSAVDERSGDLVVMDTKVTGSIDTMLKTLHLMEQGPMYAVLAKITDGDSTRGFRVIWNMIKNTKQTARARPPFYQRYELAINDDQLRQFYSQLQGQMEDILRTEERLNAGESHIKVAYPTPSGDCSWKCPYVSVCGLMGDPRNDVDWLIQAAFTTPKQREDAKIEDEQRRSILLATEQEGDN